MINAETPSGELGDRERLAHKHKFFSCSDLAHGCSDPAPGGHCCSNPGSQDKPCPRSDRRRPRTTLPVPLTFPWTAFTLLLFWRTDPSPIHCHCFCLFGNHTLSCLQAEEKKSKISLVGRKMQENKPREIQEEILRQNLKLVKTTSPSPKMIWSAKPRFALWHDWNR